jgi:squalene-hopene/tetraprenyl-beta-curcumene cyclase
LPFDRSAPELTAHAVRAWKAWQTHLQPALRERIDRAVALGLRFIGTSQGPEGEWTPLWFGNEHAPGEANPVYGTAQVLFGLQELAEDGRAAVLRDRGVRYLESQQNADGGWGGARGAPSTVEETAVVVEALAGGGTEAAERGLEWLVQAVESGAFREAAPIGLYFARLWYSERLYPLIFTARALGRFSSKHG